MLRVLEIRVDRRCLHRSGRRPGSNHTLRLPRPQRRANPTTEAELEALTAVLAAVHPSCSDWCRWAPGPGVRFGSISSLICLCHCTGHPDPAAAAAGLLIAAGGAAPAVAVGGRGSGGGGRRRRCPEAGGLPLASRGTGPARGQGAPRCRLIVGGCRCCGRRSTLTSAQISASA